jgi:nucleoside-diphosphate-sugar epimerase
MKLLVTGNMGYVGPVVVERLRRAFPNATLVGFDAGYFGSCLTGTDVLPECALDQQVFGDVRDFDAALLKGTDAVVHLAAISNDPIGNIYEQVTYQINHLATVELAKQARAAKVGAFIFASSCSMYGSADNLPRSEQSKLDPLTPYAKSKVLAEADLRKVAAPDFAVTSLRFATACGMSPRLRLDLVLNDFVACAVAGQTISVLSDGSPWRPLINVADMARAIEWAVIRDHPQGEHGFLAVNVGCDAWNNQIKDLAHAVAARIEGGKVSINQQAPPDKRSYRVDFDLYKRLAPDHQPAVDLDRSVVELRDGLRGMGFSDGDFRKSGLMRINHLTRLREKGVLDDELRWTRRMALA